MIGKHATLLVGCALAAALAAGLWWAERGVFAWHKHRPGIAAFRALHRLPPSLLTQLRPRMHRHAETMRALTNAVQMLDHARAAEVAATILDDPELARPLTAEADALATRLPADFHELEAELQQRTRLLLDAARARDDDRLATAESELAWTCERCHATFAPEGVP